MTIERKVGMGIAGQPSGDAANVADVFSTHLFTGNNVQNVINNGIDLAGEGGLVWLKPRSGNDHALFDTNRGIKKSIFTNSTGAQETAPAAYPRDLTNFNSNGFTLNQGYHTGANTNNVSSVSWTFRKKEKFFDIVTYTGNYVAGREISHGLAGPVGMMIIKCLSNNEDWAVYHRRANGGVNPQNFKLILNNASAAASGYWNNTAPTDSSFTVGQAGEVNGNNQTYVAYLFADNSSEDADDQMIKCGSYTGNASTLQDINLGWEPQFLIVKNSSASGGWYMWDSMRGWLGGANNGDGHPLYTNQASAEFNDDDVGLLSNGFQVADALNTNTNSYIYMAIRAPMMKKPEAATDVFAMDLGTGSVPSFISGFPVDMAFNASYASAATHKIVGTRLTVGRYLDTTVSGAEANEGHNTFDFMNGWNKDGRSSAYLCWMWKRAKGFFDVVTYSGTGSARTQAHSLGVVPEMIWVKSRSDVSDWAVYNKTITATKFLALNNADSAVSLTSWWNNTEPTSASFTLGNSSGTNASGRTYIAYLFATLDGISKVGTFVSGGSGVTVNVDCGFSNGARFVLIKALTTDSWYFWDTVRGIVSGNDSRLSLDNNNAVVTNQDNIDPYSAGFSLNGTLIGNSGNTFIFYAIA